MLSTLEMSIKEPQVVGNQLSWQDASNAAAAKGGRLPTIAEVRTYLNFNTAWNKDMWWPVSDSVNEWVSVGNGHPQGKLHSPTWGKPAWGLSSGQHGHRDVYAIVLPGTTTQEQAVNHLFNQFRSFKRVCPSCAPSHREIFYKRLTPVGASSLDHLFFLSSFSKSIYLLIRFLTPMACALLTFFFVSFESLFFSKSAYLVMHVSNRHDKTQNIEC
jgi:hypothetical protein